MSDRFRVLPDFTRDCLCSIEDTEAGIPTFYNDLSYCFSAVSALCDLLNELDGRVKELEAELQDAEKC